MEIVEKRHPTIPVLVRSDGIVKPLNRRSKWTIGSHSSYGYRTIKIAGTVCLVHRLVLETFVGPCPEGMECDHRNHNTADNRIENLAWITHSDNMYNTCCSTGEIPPKPLPPTEVLQALFLLNDSLDHKMPEHFNLSESQIKFGINPSEDPKLYAHRYRQSAYAKQQQAIRNTLVAVTMANGSQVFVEPDQASKLLALPKEQRKEIPVSKRERLQRYSAQHSDYYKKKSREYYYENREKCKAVFAKYRATHKYVKMCNGRQYWISNDLAEQIRKLPVPERFLYLLGRQLRKGAEISPK